MQSMEHDVSGKGGGGWGRLREPASMYARLSLESLIH